MNRDRHWSRTEEILQATQRATPETKKLRRWGTSSEQKNGDGEGSVFIEKEEEKGNGQRLEVLGKQWDRGIGVAGKYWEA